MRIPAARSVLALSVFAATLSPLALRADASATPVKDDVTVIAVIDSGFSPYHQDFLQAFGNSDIRSLPLTKAPDTWVPGFPKRSSFAGYAPLNLTLNGADGTKMDALHTKDAAQWASVRESRPGAVQYRWIPGTKVIGALTFGTLPTDRASDQVLFGGTGTVYGTGGAEHGMGTSSVAVGNQHGTCPSCVLVFVQYTSQDSAERALTWVHNQPWIDAVSNSYGFSAGLAARDRVYNGTDVITERKASERGQTTFFSAGNGVENGFVVPNSTLTSSQEGPDWVVTVGATDPSDADYSGTGKPADVAGIGTNYPSAYGSTTVSNGERFSGTSNATPQVAGTYAQALFAARRALSGPSRTQARGVVAQGGKYACAAPRRACELADGRLTAVELRNRLFLAARPTTHGYTDGQLGVADTPAPGDSRFASEGYGTFTGRLKDRYDEELAALLAPLLGRAPSQPRPAGEVAWFRVDSWCRQHVWGAWGDGSFLNGDRTPLPLPDAAWPIRTALLEGCPGLTQPPKPIY